MEQINSDLQNKQQPYGNDKVSETKLSELKLTKLATDLRQQILDVDRGQIQGLEVSVVPESEGRAAHLKVSGVSETAYMRQHAFEEFRFDPKYLGIYIDYREVTVKEVNNKD